MLKISTLLVVLVFAVVFRGLLGVISIQAGLGPSAASYVYWIASIISCVILVWGAAQATRLSRIGISTIIGPLPDMRLIGFGSVFGLMLLCLTLGENAVEAMTVAFFDKNLAYGLWNFQPTREAPIGLSIDDFFGLVVGVIVGPFAEEFFFRGLMLRSLADRAGFHVAATATAFVFMLLHIGNNYHLTAFLFAYALCYLYAVSRSLIICAIAHSTYNFAALIGSQRMEFHNVRTIDQLDSVAFWVPQMWMLGLSVTFFSYVAYRWRASITHARLESVEGKLPSSALSAVDSR